MTRLVRSTSPLFPITATFALSAACAGFAGAQEPRPPAVVGLALSGGGAKGIAHVGVLRALERLGVGVDVVAGTSMGAVVGGLYASGLSVDSIERIMTGADWPALMSDQVPRRRRFVEQRRLDERVILSVPLAERRLTLPRGAITGSNVMRTLEHVTWRVATVRRFAELPRPFVAVATDLETGEAVPLREGVLAEVLRASSGVPGALEPLELEGRLLVDGALSRNLPAKDARELGADFVICSDVASPIESAEELESIVDILSQLASLAMLSSTLEQRELCDVLVRPDIEGMSGIDFAQAREWMARGEVAAMGHADDLTRWAARPRLRARVHLTPLLDDSVRLASVGVEAAGDPRAVDLVLRELELAPGDFVSRGLLEERLGDLDATGLFRQVRYRLDSADDGVQLTVLVEERPRDRLGVGLRYDDERRAALLFTATVHNLLQFGSVTRLELRVGEETHVGLSFARRRGVTGRLGFGLSASWSQAPLQLPPDEGGRAGLEVAAASASLGLAATRSTYLGLEARAEETSSAAHAAQVSLLSGSAVLDHETLDRIDFPRGGVDAAARLEWGVSDVTPGGWFSVAAIEARAYVLLHARLTADVEGTVGHARGPDLPPHRRFHLGGAHRSAVFGSMHPLFQGLESQEQVGLAVQVARAGLRWEVLDDVFARAGVDVGAVRGAWAFPLERPMTGWAFSVGGATLVGPVVLELSQLVTNREPRVSISVGRAF
jgi:NTE family protein